MNISLRDTFGNKYISQRSLQVTPIAEAPSHTLYSTFKYSPVSNKRLPNRCHNFQVVKRDVFKSVTPCRKVIYKDRIEKHVGLFILK